MFYSLLFHEVRERKALSLMVSVATRSQFEDDTFHSREMKKIRLFLPAKQGFLVPSGSQDTTDAIVSEKGAGHLWKSLPLLSAAVVPK